MGIGLLRRGLVAAVLLTIVAGQYQQNNPVRHNVNSNYFGQNPTSFRFPENSYFQLVFRRPPVYPQKSTTQLTPINGDGDDENGTDILVGNRGNFDQSSQNKEPTTLSLLGVNGKDDSVEAVTQEVVNANNRFSSSLFNVLKSSTNGNFVFSPFSLVSIISMLQAGAQGKTFIEIQTALTFPENQANLYNGFQSLHNTLRQDASNSTFITSNRLFIQDGLHLDTEFQKILKESFNSPAQQIDFSLKDAAYRINKLVSEDTKQQIPNLIEEGILNNKTRLVALNALYFKAAWDLPFHGKATKKGEFYKYGFEKSDVHMMTTEEYFKVVDHADAKVVVLPYAGGETEMILVIPNQMDGLANIEKVFSKVPTAYDDLIEKLNNKKLKNIVLHLPRFSLQSTHDLKSTLMQLGIQQVFSEYYADLTKVTEDRRELFLSKIMQKAFLKVDEAGSEAGAATFGAVSIPLSIGPVIEETIIVNRPFMGFIRNTKTNLILFSFRKVE